MCEKCLLYSFKKFQAEYKTIYKSIYLFRRLCAGFHILIQRFDSCLSAHVEGFMFFSVGDINRDRRALADVKLMFPLFNII